MSGEVLHIGLREIGGTRVLRLTGELDSFTSDRLATIAETWINGAEKLVVNLDGLRYIDSSGLSTLVWLWVEAKDRGAELLISCHNPRIHRILEITGLVNLFTLVSSKQQASKTATGVSLTQVPVNYVRKDTAKAKTATRSTPNR